jgi:hypothetical protein
MPVATRPSEPADSPLTPSKPHQRPPKLGMAASNRRDPRPVASNGSTEPGSLDPLQTDRDGNRPDLPISRTLRIRGTRQNVSTDHRRRNVGPSRHGDSARSAHLRSVDRPSVTCQSESSLFVKRLFCPSWWPLAGSFVVRSGGSSSPECGSGSGWAEEPVYRGVSRPRRRQSRSPVALPGPSRPPWLRVVGRGGVGCRARR